MIRRSGSVLQFPGGENGGEQNLLERLFKEHEYALRRFLRLRGGSEQDLDDLVQDVFLRLASRKGLLATITKTEGSARAYMLTIANNLIIDRFRHAKMCKRHGLTEVSELPDPFTDRTPERSALAGEELQRVKDLLLRLNPKVRRAFVLSRFKCMNHRQIADDMGIGQKRVEKYISAALGALRHDRKHRHDESS